MAFYGKQPDVLDHWGRECYDLDRRLPYDVKELYCSLVAWPRFEQRTFTVAREVSSDTTWTVRRLAVERLQLDLDEELVLVDQVIRNDTRDFQKWYHRRWVVEKLGPSAASRELEFTEKMIHEDVNNSAAWSHRKWVLQEFGGDFNHELEYCAKVLGEDSFCSYAWKQRYFVVTSIWKHLEAPREVDKGKEVDYVLEFIATEPINECPWIYIRRVYGDDLFSCVNNRRVEAACVSVVKDAIKNAPFVNNVAVIKKWGCLNAVEMIIYLFESGLAPSAELMEAINYLHEVLALGY